MNRALKISIVVLSLLAALAAGEFFDFIHWMAGDLARNHPLGALPSLLVGNHQTITYYFMFPWLAFVALVGLRKQDSTRGDMEHFLLSFAFFVVCEAFVTAICLLGLEGPIYAIYRSLRGETDTSFSLAVSFCFWGAAAIVGVLLSYRFLCRK